MDNIQGLVSIVLILFTSLQFNLLQDSSSVEARGKKCKIQFRSGEYVVLCPKKIINKGSQRTFSRKRGPRGKKGEKGAPGPMGPQGMKGDIGPVGSPGPVGPKGPIGPNGRKGDVGLPGPMGSKGDSGEMGPTGAQGPPGMPGNCVSDSPIFVQRNGIHCLPGPIGPQGNKGSAGEIGIAGPQGEMGRKGDKGEQGSPGSRGSVGLPGLPGTLGKISCKTRYTAWIRQEDLYNANNVSVMCGPAEFLQGFVLEMRRTDLRYRYHCCSFS